MNDDHHSPAELKALADYFSVLGNASRLIILAKLGKREIQVNVLAKELGLGQSALSQHLAILREHAFVTTRRESQAIFYSTSHERIADTISKLHGVFFADRTGYPS
jgi:DNA-binding transcriptional ArsR family regulator